MTGPAARDRAGEVGWILASSAARAEVRRRIDRDELVDLYVTRHLPIKEVARRLDIDQQTLPKVLDHFALTRRRRSFAARVGRAHLEELYVTRGLSTRVIARQFGVDQSSVWKAFGEWGISLLGPGRGPSPRPSSPPPSEEVVSRLYLDERLSIAEVAARLKVSASTVRRVLRDGGVPLHRPGWRHRDRRPSPHVLRTLYEHDRLTTAEIGVRYGVSGHTITRWVDDAGIPRRRISTSSTRRRSP